MLEKREEKWFIVLCGLFLVVIKLLLCSQQRVVLWPESAGLDDMLMYKEAVSIVEGNWLGAYDWRTLSKHSFFPFWLAGIHKMGIPFLTAIQLLWATASLAGAWAFSPVFKRRWPSLLLFALLLFLPSSVANPHPLGFTLRVYRDTIFPDFCLICIAGLIGFALRHQRKARHSVGWLVLAGIGFAVSWLTREDGWWLLPFAVTACFITGLYLIGSGLTKKEKWIRVSALFLPFIILAGGIFGWSYANYRAYKKFVIDDFATGEFAAAYGAMTRIQHESWKPQVAVPKDVRKQLYKHVPSFAELEPLLESPYYLGRYAGEDYNSGAFYWALREAAGEKGYYENPQKASEYFGGMADEINSLCDSGVLPAGPVRKSLHPPLRREYVAPVLKETGYSLAFCATFKQCEAWPMYSTGANDPDFYRAQIAPMEEFLGSKTLAVTLEYSEKPYYTPIQKIVFTLFDGIRKVYAVMVPVVLIGALIWQIKALAKALREKKGKAFITSPTGLLWMICLGILCCILLRAAMISYVMVSSFSVGTYVMYLAAIHPLMLVYGYIGSFQLASSIFPYVKNVVA